MKSQTIHIDRRLPQRLADQIAADVGRLARDIPRARVYYVGSFGDPFLVEVVADVRRPDGVTEHFRHKLHIHADNYGSHCRRSVDENLQRWAAQINEALDRINDQKELF